MGAQFEIGETTQITGVGGHIFTSSGTLFAAIVPLAAGQNAPSFLPIDLETNAIAYTVFDPGLPSRDFIATISLRLDPGNYALIFGSGLFGASGSGGMPSNNTPLAGSTCFSSLGSGTVDATHVWGSAQDDCNRRFVVEGAAVPGGFTISKSQPSPPLEVNKRSIYTLTVITEKDNIVAEVKDQLPDGMTYVSAKGDGWDCTVDSDNLVTCTKQISSNAAETIEIEVQSEAAINNQSITNYASVGLDGQAPTPGRNCVASASQDVCAESTAKVMDIREKIKDAVGDDVQAFLASRLDQIVGTLDGTSRLQRFRDTACGVSHDMSLSGNATSSDVNIAANGSASIKGGVVPTADVPEQQCGRFNLWTEIDVGYVDGLQDSSATGGMLTLGAEYLVTDNLLAGLRLGIDYTDASFDSDADSHITGYGWLAGPLISAEIFNNIFLGGFIGYGTSWNNYDGEYEGLGLSGDFETQRIVGNLNLSGTYESDQVLLTPLVGLAYGKEWSSDFNVDNNIVGETQISSQEAELLRFTGRIEASYKFADELDESFLVVIAPKVTYDLVRSGGEEADLLLGDNLWRGGVEGGFRYTGGRVSALLLLGYDGIGVSDWSAYTGQLQLNYTW